MFEQIRVSRSLSGAGTDLLCLADGSIEQPFLRERAGTVQAVYLDPPFMTGEVFDRRRRFGTKGWKTGSPSPAYPGYDDRHESREAYLTMLRGLLTNARMLLKDEGTVMLHLDWHAGHYGRMLCDEVLGEDCFVNEIVWAYESGGRSTRHFSRKHDTILLYAKGPAHRFDLTKVPIGTVQSRENHLKRSIDENGRSYRSVKVAGKEYRYYDDEPVYPSDVWTDISHIQQRPPERTGYGTQKPIELLFRLLKPVVEPGDTVADLCCGSGTSLAAAKILGCHVLGTDLSPEALLVTRARLKSTDLELRLESSMDPVMPEGTCVPAEGVMTVAGFPAVHPKFPATQDSLDPLERWAVGELEGDAFHELAFCQRSFEQPQLIPLLMAGQPLEHPAMATVDAAGIYRVYQWKD